MMNNDNSLIEYKENIFTKIKNFFFKLFNKKTKEEIIPQNIISENESINTKDIREELKVHQDEEKMRILTLKKKLDNGEIFEEDIEENDMDDLISLYKEETVRLNEDTELRKYKIQSMLKELKVGNKAV